MVLSLPLFPAPIPPWSASTAAPNSLGAFSTKAAAEVKQKQKPTLCTAAAAIDQSGDGSWRSQFNRRRRCTRFSFFTQRMQSDHTKNSGTRENVKRAQL